MARDYYISFDIKEAAPLLLAVRVNLAKEFIRGSGKAMRVDLCDDPLCPALEQYVRDNPSKRKQ